MLLKEHANKTVQCRIYNQDTSITLCNNLRRGSGIVYFTFISNPRMMKT